MASAVIHARIENGVIIPSKKISGKGLVEIEIKKAGSVVDDTFGIWKDEKSGTDYVNEMRTEWKKRKNE
jgi:predicted DNA-binding antitoxin AbrB/MazE fold protein